MSASNYSRARSYSNNYYDDEPARSHSHSHHRSNSSKSTAHPALEALISVIGGATIATIVDKHLIENRSRRHSSHSSHHHQEEAPQSRPLRRVADIAVGGFAGLEAYHHFSKGTRSSSHEDREAHRYGGEERRSRSLSEDRHRRSEGGRYLLEAPLRSHDSWQANNYQSSRR